MLTRQVRLQLIAFAVISVVILTIASVNYIGLPQLVGFDRFQVTANFADTSGLYPRANVTYRGVDVGQIDHMKLSSTGVDVVLDINNGTHIPVGTQAQIHSTSAVGEQYLDLVPTTDVGPYLKQGSVIPRAATLEMPQTAPLLDKLNALLQSIPKKNLTNLLSELNTAIGGQGPNIGSIIDNSSSLVTTAEHDLGPTIGLINNLAPFLTQQQQLSGQTTSYVTNLTTFTDQLALSDPELRALINKGHGAATSLNNLVNAVRPTLPILLASLTSVGQVLYTYLPATQQLLVLFPPTIASSEKTYLVGLPGTTEIDFELNVDNPPPCVNGYLPANQYQDPGSTKTLPTPADQTCTEPHSAATSVRGGHNLPCLDPAAVVARESSVEACDGKAPSTLPSTNGTSTSLSVAPYEPATGRFPVGNGQFDTLSQPTVSTGNGPTSLQGLLIPEATQ